MTITVLGYVACVLTACSALPQVYKSWRSRSLDDVSAGMWWLNLAGAVVWLMYASQRHDTPLITVNLVLMWCSLAMLCMKVLSEP